MPSKQLFTPSPNHLGQSLATPAPQSKIAPASNAARADQLSSMSMPGDSSSSMCAPPNLWGQSLAQSTQAKASAGRSPQAKSSTHLQQRDAGAAENLSAMGLATGAKFDAATAVVQNSRAMGNSGESMQKALGHAGTVAGTTLGLMGHLLGDEQIAESDAGHATASVLKTGGELANGAGINRYLDVHDKMRNISGVSKTSPMSGTGRTLASNPLVAAVAGLDELVDVDNPMKLATAMTAELHPGTQINKAFGGGVDAFTAAAQYMSGNEAASMRSAEAVEEKSVNSDYGAISQALTLWTGMAMGDKEVQDKAVDQKAKTGERGLFLAWGNAAEDGMSDRQEGGHYSNFDRALQESRDRRIYKPWTW